EYPLTILYVHLLPFTGPERADFIIPDHHAQQTQRWMSHCRCHPAHLVILPLDQLHRDPAICHSLANANRRITRRHFWLWIERPHLARQRVVLADSHSAAATLHFPRPISQSNTLHAES